MCGKAPSNLKMCVFIGAVDTGSAHFPPRLEASALARSTPAMAATVYLLASHVWKAQVMRETSV